MKNKIIAFKILILFFLFCFGAAGSIFGIGMITEPIVVDNMLRGGEVIKTVTVLNSGAEDAVYIFGAREDIAEWVTFFETDDLETAITETIAPAGSYYNIIAKIKVPEGTPNGQYNGSIYVQESPQESDRAEGAVSIAKRISTRAAITVTDQEVVDIKTTLIPESFNLAQNEPLKIRVIYDNFGNIVLEPSLQVRIIDVESEKAVFNAIFPYPDEEKPIIPGERREISALEWHSAGQPEGRYRAEISTLINGEVLEENSFRFSIGNVPLSGDLLGNKFLAAVSAIGRGSLMLGWFVIGGILLVLAGILTFLYKRPAKLEVRITRLRNMGLNVINKIKIK